MQVPMAQSRQSKHVRLRIQSIDIAFDTPPKYPTNLKLIANGRLLFNLNAIYADQPLRWEDINPIDADPSSTIEIRVYELHWLGKKRVRVGAVGFKAHEMEGAQSSITVRDDGANLPFGVSVTMASKNDSQSAAQAQCAASIVVEMSPSLLASIGQAKDKVDAMIKIGQSLAELNPIAKAVVGVFTQAWETLKKQDQCETLVAELVTQMGDLLPYMAEVKDHARVTILKNTIEKVLHLVEDASRFILQYMSERAAARTARAYISSSAQGQVDGFIQRFATLKEEIDRGMAIHTLKQVDVLLDDADRALLTQLLVADASFDPNRSCLEGTRVEIIEDIKYWALSSEHSPLFWLYALAGCGKSSVATSIAQLWHDTGALAGSFFCKRDSPHLREPKKIVSHLAALLGLKYPAYGTKLVNALRREPELAHSAARTVFKGLIVELLQSMSVDTQPEGTLAVVVDAIDEIPSPEGRVELAGYLLEMSKLKPWLKVLVTSRPNEELRLLLGSSENRNDTRDLFTEDETSVSRDILAYISNRMKDIPAEAVVCEGWPDEADMHRLRDSSNGLFIWARTACNLIQQSLSPSDTMKQIIEGERSKDAKKAIGEIYTTALNEGLGVTHDNAEVIRLCIGAVILTGSRRPLPDAALATMLTGRVKPHMLSRVISRLASVLYRDHTSAVRVLHQSFSDYMKEEDCPKEYRVDVVDQNAQLAAASLEIMLQNLKFNICHLEDSCIMNRDVPNLQDRINRSIKPELLYSCIYWPSHLIQQPFDLTHGLTIRLFDRLLHGKHILFWIEVLSLVGEMHIASTTITQLIEWLDNSESKYTKTAVELDRFISAAFPCISESAPHLYISAIPFGAANYAVIRGIQAHFPNSVSVIGGLNLWNVQPIRTIQTGVRVGSIAVSSDGRRIAVSGSTDGKVQIWDAQTGTLSLTLEGHSSTVGSVAFSSDGQHIISGSSDSTVRIWNARTGAALLSPLRGHSSNVASIAFSPDGRRIVSGSSDMTVRMWDTQTGAPFLGPLRGHSRSVTSVAFSSNGQRIVSGSWDQTVRMWDTQTGTPFLDPLRGHSGSVMSVAFSSDGRRIVSGSIDKTVQIWDAETGAALLLPLRGHSDNVVSVAFSSNGRRIVSGSIDKTVRIWDAYTGAALLEPLEGHSSTVASVAFSPDDRRIVTGSIDKTVRIWDAQPSAALLEPLEGHSSTVASVAFSSDGQHIISGSSDSTVRIWNAWTGAGLLEPLRGHSGPVTSVAFSYDGQRIVSGSDDKTVRTWDAETGAALLLPLRGHSDSVVSVAFSSDGRRIVSGSIDKTVRIWDSETGAALLQPLRDHLSTVGSVGFSPDGLRIVSGSSDGRLRIWDAQTGAALLKHSRRGDSGSVTSVAFSSDGQCLASALSDGTVRIWDAHRPEIGSTPSSSRKDYSPAAAFDMFSPDSPHTGVSGSLDLAARTWNAQKSSQFLKLLREYSISAKSTKFSSHNQSIVSGTSDKAERIWGKHIASEYNDKTVRMWEAGTGLALQEKYWGHSADVAPVAFSSDGQRMVSGYSDKTLRMWDTQTGAPLLKPLRGHSRSVTAVAFSSDGQRIVSGSDDMTVRIWDAQTGAVLLEPLEGHSGDVTSAAFWSGGQRIVSGSHKETVPVWRTPMARNPFVLEELLLDSSRFVHIYDWSIWQRFIYLTLRFTSQKYSRVPFVSVSQIVDGDGWLCEGGRRLFWIPPQYHLECTVDHLSITISRDLTETRPIWFDMSKIKFGAAWGGIYAS
ncbi:hypothetical protein FRC12_016753 [Ceratobasidium sp. 428]|nr:hypothetical protein FRC12_016753 [Ceratobasidium sp. 428]